MKIAGIVFELRLRRQTRHLIRKAFVGRDNNGGANKSARMGMTSKKRSDFLYGLGWFVVMHTNVLTRNIRNISLVGKLLFSQDISGLFILRRSTKTACTNENSKLKRHIKSRESAICIELSQRKIMDTKIARFDHVN